MTTAEFKNNIKEALEYAISEYKLFLDQATDEHYSSFNGYINEDIDMPMFMFGVCSLLGYDDCDPKYIEAINLLGRKVIKKCKLRDKYKDVAPHDEEEYWFRTWFYSDNTVELMKLSHQARIEVMELLMVELENEKMSTPEMEKIINNLIDKQILL